MGCENDLMIGKYNGLIVLFFCENLRRISAVSAGNKLVESGKGTVDSQDVLGVVGQRSSPVRSCGLRVWVKKWTEDRGKWIVGAGLEW